MNRYIAQSRLPELDADSQRRLADSKVLVVGCGALGSPVGMYLAGAGVGHIIVADFDNVELSNLHRQVFYSESEIGKNKAELLASRMLSLNSEIKVDALTNIISGKLLNSPSPLHENLDLVIDAADNPSTTYLLQDYCERHSLPFITAGVSEWKAQVFLYIPGSATYGQIVPRPSDESGILPCSIAGIAGPTAAFAASLQASEALLILSGHGPESSSLFTADLRNHQFSHLSL